MVNVDENDGKIHHFEGGKENDFDWAIFNSHLSLPEGMGMVRSHRYVSCDICQFVVQVAGTAQVGTCLVLENPSIDLNRVRTHLQYKIGNTPSRGHK